MANEVNGNNLRTDCLADKHISGTAAIARSKMAQRVLAIDNIPLTQARVWDARQTVLPGTSATDDLSLATGTLGTDLPTIQTSDLKTAGSTSRYAGFLIPIPLAYEDGESITIRVVGNMKTAIADTSCVTDIQAYLSAENGLVGSDICTTAAQSINSLTAANRDFVITPTNVVAGDMLDVRLAIICNDAAGGSAVIGRIIALKLMTDQR